MLRKALTVIAALILLALAVLLYAHLEARRDPVVRSATIHLADWPAGAAPVRVVLISDIHVGTSAMTAARLQRIVAQINSLNPDIVFIAGDFIYGHDPRGAIKLGEPLVEPLSHLKPRFGVVAVLGNHDQWTGPGQVRALLARANITVIENHAIVRGPLAIGGVGDDFSHHDNLAATIAAVRKLAGAKLLLTHSPDIGPNLPADMPLLLAGHTHCGQVILPLYGPVSDVSRRGARYRCGIVREGARTVVVTAGLGTSGGPFRLGAPPDLWLLTLGP